MRNLFLLCCFLCVGCEPINTKRSYGLSEWDAVVEYKNGQVERLSHVESPAKIKNGLYYIYDYPNTFEVRIMIPVDDVKLIRFVKPQ